MEDSSGAPGSPLLVKTKMTPMDNRSSKVPYQQGTGTLVSSMFTLANSAIGSGILAFPYAFKKTGLGLGLIVTVIFAGIMGACLHFVTVCTHRAQEQDPRIRSYQELAGYVGGKKLSAFLEGTLIVYLLGCCCGFLIIVADMVKPLLGDSLGSAANPRSIVIVAVGVTVVFPLCLLRRISALRFSSMFAIVAVFYMVCAIAYEYFHMPTSDATDHVDHEVVWFEADADILAALPLLAFALQCHIQAPLIFTELRASERTVARMDSVCAGAYALCLTLYVPAGIFGYLTFGPNTLTDILKGYTDVSDKVADVARVCIGIVACCGYPLNHFPARSALWGIWQRKTGQAGKEMPKKWMIVEAAIWVAVTIGVALVVTDLGVVFGLIGSVAGSLVIFFIPAFLWWRLGPQDFFSHKVGTYTVLCVGTLVFVMGTLTTLKIL